MDTHQCCPERNIRKKGGAINENTAPLKLVSFMGGNLQCGGEKMGLQSTGSMRYRGTDASDLHTLGTLVVCRQHSCNQRVTEYKSTL